MKHILRITAVATLTLGVVGCKLSDIEYPSTATPKIALTDEASVYSVMNGVYYLKFTTYRSNFQFLMIGMSDMFVATNRAETELLLSKRRILPNDGQISWIWNRNYAAIQSANNLIRDVVSIPMNEGIRNMFTGQCQFLRGWAYYELTRLWGRVPIHDDIVTSESDFHIPRSSINDVYSVIFRNFHSAYKNLATKSEMETLAQGRDESDKARSYLSYYANKSTAQAALAHSCLSYANYLSLEERDSEARIYYDSAYIYATAVIDEGIYSLSSDFAGLYDYKKREAAKQEIMFKATFIGDDLNEGFLPSGIYLPNTSTFSSRTARQVLLMPWYVEQFSVDPLLYDHSLEGDNPLRCDPRFSANFITRWLFTGDNVANKGKTMIVFPDKGGTPVNYTVNPPVPQAVINDNQTAFRGFPMIGLYRDPDGGSVVTQLNGDFPLLRLGEMYLIQAEAMNELEDYSLSEVLTPVNKLRARARAITEGMLPKELDQEALEAYMESVPPMGIAMQVGSVVVPETDRKYAIRRLILKERDLELLGENRRYFDLKRMRAKDKHGAPRTMFEYFFGEHYPQLKAELFGNTCTALIADVNGGGIATWPGIRYTPEPLLIEVVNGQTQLLVENPEAVSKYLWMPIPSNEMLYNTAMQSDQNRYW